MAYTYDDFVKAANDAGVMGSFNENDLSTARQNPEFGLSLVTLQKDMNGATTPEAKMLATEAANQLRKTYGNYTINDARAMEYADGYKQQLQAALDKVVNPQAFSYNAEDDPMYRQYRKTYLREGDRAMADTLGKASAMTQGRPSSYAVSAANQANNYYAAQLADAIPNLRNNAYSEYLQGLQMDAAKLQALQGADETAYQRYLKGIDIKNQEISQAMALYQLLGDRAPQWALDAMGIQPVQVVAAGGGGDDGGGGGGGYSSGAKGTKTESKNPTTIAGAITQINKSNNYTETQKQNAVNALLGVNPNSKGNGYVSTAMLRK